MNDLDLRAALHRDADLVGDPAPDLLAQLARRGDQQRHRRAGLLVAALMVVVLGASVPVAASFMTQSEVGPAVEKTVEPTPTVVETPEPTPVVPAPNPTPVEPQVVEASPSEDVVAPGCPDQATLLPLVHVTPAPPSELVTNSFDTICSASGEWALTVFSQDHLYPEGVDPGPEYGMAYPVLFRFADGGWSEVNRGQSCKAGLIPDDIWELTCNAG